MSALGATLTASFGRHHTHHTGPAPECSPKVRATIVKPTAELSFTRIFNAAGVTDFRRKGVRVRSRLPTEEEAWRLRMPQTEHVLETEVTNVTAEDTPLVYANTCFAAAASN